MNIHTFALTRSLTCAGLLTLVAALPHASFAQAGPDNYDFRFDMHVTVENVHRDVEYVYVICDVSAASGEHLPKDGFGASTHITPVNGTVDGDVTVYILLENDTDLGRAERWVCNIAARCGDTGGIMGNQPAWPVCRQIRADGLSPVLRSGNL